MAILYVIYKILSVPPIYWLPFIVWFAVMKITVLILYTIVIGAVVIVICLVLLMIALLNALTKGKLNKLVLCQNSPTSWYQTPNFHLGNKCERSLFCKSPCASGYMPDELTGEFCNRIPTGQPSYCPQAEVMRILSGFSRRDSQHIYANYNPAKSLSFNFMTPEEKEREYKYYFLKRRGFFNKCSESLSNYNPMILNICAYTDMLRKHTYNGLSPSDIKRLEEACGQGFCNSKNRHFFCGKFEESQVTQTGNSLIVRYIVSLLITAILFTFMLLFTYQVVQSV
jgi:energy-coupling factor transporter transmembrane protein EcfT